MKVVQAMRNWIKGAMRNNDREESKRNSGILKDILGKFNP